MSIQKVQLLIICLFIPVFSFGQLNEFAPSNAKWKFFHEGAGSFPDWYYEIVVEGDSVIQNKQCRILKYRESGLVGPVEVTEIIYTEENRAYLYRDSLFHLIFDFDAEIDDTIIVFENNFKPFFHVEFEGDSSFIDHHNYFAYTILDIDSINRNGNWLKHQSVKGIGDWRIHDITEYFGGVGTLGYGSHIFGESNHYSTVGDGQFDLMYCYEEEDIELPVSSNYDCQAYAVGVNNINLGNEISIYPNPALTFFKVAYQIEKQETVFLYNSLGQLVNEVELNPSANSQTISTESFTEGIYYWQLANQNGKLIIIR